MMLISFLHFSDNEIIKWNGNMGYLNGNYEVKIEIFPQTSTVHGQVILEVYEGNKKMNSYNAIPQKMHDGLSLYIKKNIQIRHGYLIIRYKGDGPLKMQIPGYITVFGLGNAQYQ